MRKLLAAVAALLATDASAAGPAFECVMENRMKAGETMTMTFAAIDLESGKGMIIGNGGTADASVVQTPNAMHFFEFTGSGP